MVKIVGMHDQNKKQIKKPISWRWIVGGVAVIVAGITAIAYLGWSWLIPSLFLAGAVALWRYRHGWVRIVLIYACMLSIVGITAYGMLERHNRKDNSGSKDAVTTDPEKPKLVAETPTASIDKPPARKTNETQKLAEITAQLEEAKAAIAALQADKPMDNGGLATEKTIANDTPPADPEKNISGVLPQSGDEGPLSKKMQSCWYSNSNEMTCKGLLLNRMDRQKHIYLMDSEGFADNGDESRHFTAMTFGGSIRFSGDGGNVAMLGPHGKATFLVTFFEPNRGIKSVDLTLNMQGDDAITHSDSFIDIPVNPHRY